MMQRGIACPMFRLNTIGRSGLSMTFASSCRYSSLYVSSIGLPTNTPDTASNTPALFRYSSDCRYQYLIITSSLCPRKSLHCLCFAREIRTTVSTFPETMPLLSAVQPNIIWSKRSNRTYRWAETLSDKNASLCYIPTDQLVRQY